MNVDLMHGLSGQSAAQAVGDLKLAHNAGATHISWYQLTIEPNTVFYRNTPTLPDEDTLADIEWAGQDLLNGLGYQRYEVSAWVGTDDRPCLHNQNYWQFGDYLAIGAGAHGKVSLSGAYLSQMALTDDHITGAKPTAESLDPLSTELRRAACHIPRHTPHHTIARFSKSRLPKDYLNQNKWHKNATATSQYSLYPKTVGFELIDKAQLPSEFMLNVLRLSGGVPRQLFTQRTGLPFSAITDPIDRLVKKGLIKDDPNWLVTTALGQKYLNQVLYEFI